MKNGCENIIKIDYGFQMLPGTALHIANQEEQRWLLQPELKAIKDGLTYDEKTIGDCTSKGYFNAQGQMQGVGIKLSPF